MRLVFGGAPRDKEDEDSRQQRFYWMEYRLSNAKE